MAGNISFARMKELAQKKQDGSSGSKLLETPPATTRPDTAAAAAEEIATPKFRALEDTQVSPTTQGSPTAAELKSRKRGKRLHKEGGLSSPQTGEIGIVDLDLLEDSPPQKKSRLATDEGSRSPTPFSMERFIKKNYEGLCSNPFEALAELLRHGADLHMAIKQEAVTKIKAVAKEKDEALNLAAEYRKTLEKTSAALEQAKKEKEHLELEKKEVLKDKQSLEVRVREAEEKVGKADERASKAEERANKAASDLASSTTTISVLRAKVADLELQLTETTKAKDAEISSIAGEAITLAEQAFNNALAQIAVLHPNITLDKEILKAEHEVRDGKIGIPSADGKDFTLVDLPPNP